MLIRSCRKGKGALSLVTTERVVHLFVQARVQMLQDRVRLLHQRLLKGEYFVDPNEHSVPIGPDQGERVQVS